MLGVDGCVWLLYVAIGVDGCCGGLRVCSLSVVVYTCWLRLSGVGCCCCCCAVRFVVRRCVFLLGVWCLPDMNVVC